MTNQWSQQAVETITTNLVKLNKPYKYIELCLAACGGTEKDEAKEISKKL
uniref:Uncharacterized protein n=1 Tax=Parascaris equorum TaxID=6256 RepID=A0A914RM82_PAREQ